MRKNYVSPIATFVAFKSHAPTRLNLPSATGHGGLSVAEELLLWRGFKVPICPGREKEEANTFYIEPLNRATLSFTSLMMSQSQSANR